MTFQSLLPEPAALLFASFSLVVGTVVAGVVVVVTINGKYLKGAKSKLLFALIKNQGFEKMFTRLRK